MLTDEHRVRLSREWSEAVTAWERDARARDLTARWRAATFSPPPPASETDDASPPSAPPA